MTGRFFGTEYYEDLEIGERWKTHSKTITELEIVIFNNMMGLLLPAFVDENYIKEKTLFGRRFASGVMTIPFVAGLFSQLHILDDSLLAMLGMEAKMIKPVFAGDTIYVDARVVDKRETSKADRGIVYFLYLARNQDDEILAEITEIVMVRRKPK